MKKFGLIGHPLGHSLSPLIHSLIMKETGIDGEYKLYDISPEDMGKEIPILLESLDGFNCTIPHKNVIREYLNIVTYEAKQCDAVNTVYKGVGHNTDILGFSSYKIDVKDKHVLILGCGGTSRMMLSYCIRNGASNITIVARDTKKAYSMVDAVCNVVSSENCNIICISDLSTITTAFDVILNGTPVGMWPKSGGLYQGIENVLGQDKVVFDAIYNPLPTRLIANAKKSGADAYDGLKMLVRQAIEAQKIWNPDVDIDADSLEEIILPKLYEELKQKYPKKIVLTGFMGCGKSTVGKILADKIGFKFIDLDEEIEKFAKMSIREIFENSGEQVFRIMEKTVAELVLSNAENCVVSTGGGFPIQEANVDVLRTTNSLVILIDITLEEAKRRVLSDKNRPLAKDENKFEDLYNSRYNQYHKVADYVCLTSSTTKAEGVANEIARVAVK